jgi:hypothetical protein
LLAHGWWFSPASSTSKTGRHDIAEILLKVALSTSVNGDTLKTNLERTVHNTTNLYDRKIIRKQIPSHCHKILNFINI